MLSTIHDQKWQHVNEDVAHICLHKTKNFKSARIDSLDQHSHTGLLEWANRTYAAVLQDHVLILQSKWKLEFVLDFNQFPATLKVYQDLTFSLHVDKQAFLFQSSNPIQWIQSLNFYISTSKPRYPSPTIESFWLKHRQSFEEFTQQADTLDVLLFKNKTLVCTLQRLITNSGYDHVALLLRSNQNKLHVFEANSDDGVCIFTWESLANSNFQQYVEKMAYRKLKIQRDTNLLIRLQEFIAKNHGKAYSVSLQKLCKKRSIAGQEKENFFCSELVASCYKTLGLIDPDVSACQFWPRDFAKDLILRNATLSHEIIIYE